MSTHELAGHRRVAQILRAHSLFILLFVALFSSSLTTIGCGGGGCVAEGEDGVAMSNAEVRAWYNAQVSAIPEQNQAWLAEGLSAEDRARRAYTIRHEARIEARKMMPSRGEVAQLRIRDRAKYGSPDGPTFDYLLEKNRKKGLEGDAIYEAIIESSARTDEKVNARFEDKK